MPELPEVETVRRGLEPVMSGHRIVKAQVRRPDLRWPFPERMEERLTGARVNRMGRRSKYLLVELDTDETLIVHLGMSGRMLIQGQTIGDFVHDIPPVEKHDHVVFDLDQGVRIVFNDARRFGAMDLCPTSDIDQHWLIEKLGPEPLGNDFNTDHLQSRFDGKRTPVKSALLDQRIIAGLGNIYVCEALWRAGISPKRLAKNISTAKLGSLTVAIRDVIAEAIESGGSSLKDYRQADGELGYFQHRFRAYGREGERCQRKDCEGEITRITQSGRSTFYCKTCQR